MFSAATSPPDEVERPLADSIAAATRSVHAKLNKLIIARLPLAIPPRSNDPSIYASGLLHIAPIYIAFESLWKSIVEPSTEVRGSSGPLASSEISPQVLNHEIRVKGNINSDERKQSVLKSLYLPGLMRSDRLRSDIGSLTGWSPADVEKQLRAISESGRLAEFRRHIKRTIEKKPHVLVSYSYILYMALFAGGRFIRATLESAGSEFWEQLPSPIPSFPKTSRQRPTSSEERSDLRTAGPVKLSRGDSGTLKLGAQHSRQTLPLSFFHFATVLDGEDLRKEFKRQLSESESLLTSQERHDITQEAVCIFDNMLLLVDQLDDVCDTSFDDEHMKAFWASLGSGSRLRDSVVVTRERRAQASSRGSGDSERSNTWLCKHARQKKSEAGQAPNPIDLEGHPPSCCPASKSMRFEGKLPVPDRKGIIQTFSTNNTANAHLPTQPSKSITVSLSNIVLVAGLAAIVSMFFLTRRSAENVLVAEE